MEQTENFNWMVARGNASAHCKKNDLNNKANSTGTPNKNGRKQETQDSKQYDTT